MTQVWRALSMGIPAVGIVWALLVAGHVVRVRYLRLRGMPEPSIAKLLLALYIAVIVAVTLMPVYGPMARSFVALPWDSAGLGTPLHAALNVILFTPFGILLSLTGVNTRAVRTIAAGLTVPVGVELAQYLVGVGRVSSTADAMAGTLGVIVGVAIVRLASQLRRLRRERIVLGAGSGK